jgi:hypothetical protein
MTWPLSKQDYLVRYAGWIVYMSPRSGQQKIDPGFSRGKQAPRK